MTFHLLRVAISLRKTWFFFYGRPGEVLARHEEDRIPFLLPLFERFFFLWPREVGKHM